RGQKLIQKPPARIPLGAFGMQIKHTFLFSLVLGLVWTGYLFAYITGPEPGRNGLFAGNTCATSGCHTGNPINSTSGNGSVTLASLPSAGWSSGQTSPMK